MRVGIVVPYIGNFGAAGFYNSQELGMAKALVELGHEAVVVKTYDCRAASRPDGHDASQGVQIRYLPARAVGSHGLFSPQLLSEFGLERIITLSDVQWVLPSMDAWATRQSIPLTPYIGTIESDRGRRGLLSQWARRRNVAVYRRRHCYAKTPAVLEALKQAGVSRVALLPVGLDRESLAHGLDSRQSSARETLRLPAQARIAAFVGRLMAYKCPLGIVAILEELRKQGESWQIVVVGDGPLRSDLELAIEAKGFKESVTIIPKIPQSDMWQVYRAADVLINLNPQEIFGMCILESLYYGTPVVAVDAPGPRFIIRDGMDGYVVGPDDPRAIASALVRAAEERETLSGQAHQGIIERFDWRTNIERSGILEAG